MANIATKSTLNQISARRIKEMTGVDLIVTKIGLRKASKYLLVPANIPNETPKIKEIIKPIIPRKIVAPITLKKSSFIKMFNVAIIVDSGDGRIKSDWYNMDATFQIPINTNTEITEIILFIELLFFMINLFDRKLQIKSD